MNTKALFTLTAVVLIAASAGAYVLITRNTSAPAGPDQTASPKDATYLIDGQPVTLTNGVSVVSAAPGSAAQTTTRYFGNEATGDLNGDGTPDVAFLLTRDSGGSGTFYYVVGALKTDTGYEGTAAVFLGDRIAPQTTEIRNGTLIVNYADRAAGESFVVQPSIGKSLYLKLDPATKQFGEVVQDFEGEANPSSMTLEMKTWNWIHTRYNDGTTVAPRAPKFSLTFLPGHTFSATTDCNTVSGAYSASSNEITFSQMASTMMFCEGSQEQDFTKMLGEVNGYLFTSKGELVLDLKFDSGSMLFN